MRPRIATPLDHYVTDFTAWFQGLWPIWIALVALVVVVSVLVILAKARARSRARVPRYRRQETGPIQLSRSRP